MYKLILFFSLFPIALALGARWWFGQRILTSLGGRPCRADLKRWTPPLGHGDLIHREEASASVYGADLRRKALEAWKTEDPRAHGSRENTRRFGMAVPPLSAVVAIFAVFVGKIPVLGAFAILLGATALAAALGLLTLPPELVAIARQARKARDERWFPDREDEEAAIRCASAHAWDQALPPILRWIRP